MNALNDLIDRTVAEEMRTGGFSGSYKVEQMNEKLKKGKLPIMARDVYRGTR